MLKILSRNHRSVPLFCCGFCSSWIDDIDLGAAVFVAPNHEGDVSETFLAHKGACHDALEAKLGAGGRSVGWQELGRYLLDALHNGGLTYEKIQEIQQRELDVGGRL